MNTIRHYFKTYALFQVLVYFILGLSILINPKAVFNIVVYVISGYLVILGLLNIFSSVKLKKKLGEYGFGLMIGIVEVLAGFFILAFAASIVSILPILLGIIIIISGVNQFLTVSESKLPGRTGWLIYSGILIAAGVVFLFNPFGTVLLVFRIFGGILLLMSISEAFVYFKLK